MNTLEFARQHPKAFAALPEAYQADDCLFFYMEGGWLYCGPSLDQEQFLGNWRMEYDEDANVWTQIG